MIGYYKKTKSTRHVNQKPPYGYAKLPNGVVPDKVERNRTTEEMKASLFTKYPAIFLSIGHLLEHGIIKITWTETFQNGNKKSCC